jgi:uncharacterized damage-inducible protein DinB
MIFSLSKHREILERTPAVLATLLQDLSDEWIHAREGEHAWSPKEVVAHLIVCEKTNWLTRIQLMLSDSPSRNLVPIDMQAHFKLAENRTMQELLNEFAQCREAVLEALDALPLQERDFSRTALHPVLGEVNLKQLISAWVTHDLTHTAQIVRVLAKQRKDHVGGFEQFLRILHA